MDLRIVKTKKVIREALLKLRKTTPLEKIKVREVCREALINKSTFYNHYEDVFALSAEIEDEVLTQCIEEFAYKDLLFTEPLKFLSNVPRSLDAHNDLISVLYAGRYEVLYSKLQRKMREYYSRPDMTMQEDVQLTFVVGGMMYAMQELTHEGKYTEADITPCIAKTIEKLQK